MSATATGTLGVVATAGLVAGCIRLGTRSHVDHVILADGVGGCYEAIAGHGVRHLPTVPYGDVAWLARLPLLDGQRADITAYCQDAIQVGVRYNYPAIAVFTVRTAAPWLPHKHLDEWADRRAPQICSELAVNATRFAHLDMFPGRLAATVSPADLENLAIAKGWL